MTRFASLAAVAGMAVSVTAQTVPIVYCSSFNTASGAGNFSIYQSDGLCSGFCEDDHAFSVVQGKNCWCSDIQPSGSGLTDTDNCNDPCPGWTDDWCGGDGLFAYMRHNTKPTATTDGGSSQSTPPSDTTTSSPSETSDNTPAPSQSISTITQDGTVSLKTVYVQPTGTSDADASSNKQPVSDGDDGLSTGAAVGISIGVVAAVLIVGGIIFFAWYRRRKNDEQASIVERTNSARGSSRGMMGTPRTEMASIWDENGSQARRNSRYMPHDPRMDPFAGNAYHPGNKSRESIGSLEDSQDYSRRVLRTTNPDPE